METGRQATWMRVAIAAAFAAASVCPMPAQEDESMSFRYGFRYDPMQFIESGTSLAAAQVRTVILGAPKAGDAEILEAEIGTILATQEPDGNLGDNTAGQIIRLARLGCDLHRPEVQRAVEAMCAEPPETEGRVRAYALEAACLAEWDNVEVLKRWTEAAVAEWMTLDPWAACPWHGGVQLAILWSAREYADVMPAVERLLSFILEQVSNGRGWTTYLDPWGFLNFAGFVDHPLARQIVVEQLPMILRAQGPDGSFGGMNHLGWGAGSRTFTVYRALAKWGLLDELPKLPPLPPDWKIGRSIPAPDGNLSTMTWDGERFWVRDKASHQALAVSADDGSVVHRLTLPEKTRGIGWHNGSLAVSRNDPMVVLLLDPQSGDVRREISWENAWGGFAGVTGLGDAVCVGNGMCGGVHIVRDPVEPNHPVWLGGTFMEDLAPQDGTLWHLDAFAPAIVRSAVDGPGEVLEWGEKPFGEDTAGIAHDGEHLWALDNEAKRICIIEKTESGRAPASE